MKDTRTINRLLLFGARHHERDGVFVHWKDDAWVTTPDWRADRHSIRIALALRERYGVESGDAVTIRLPLSVEWALVERAVWGLGATSVSSSEQAVACVDAALFDELLEIGGVLDTPERATLFRKVARDVPSETIASVENGTALTHAAWVRAVDLFHVRYPAVSGRTHWLVSGTPAMPSRVALYAGWSDGLTRTAMGPDPSETELASFVRLFDDGLLKELSANV